MVQATRHTWVKCAEPALSWIVQDDSMHVLSLQKVSVLWVEDVSLSVVEESGLAK